jgi:hypothetical protein
MESSIDEVINALSGCYNNKYIISKKKKKIMIKDGIITYKIITDNNLEKIRCQCMSTDKTCSHLMFLLSKHFNMSCLVISLMNHKKVYRYFMNNYIRLGFAIGKQMDLEIDNLLDDAECGVCLYHLLDDKFNCKLYKCLTCKKNIHLTCMNKWMSTKTKNSIEKNGCIYCMTKEYNSMGF